MPKRRRLIINRLKLLLIPACTFMIQPVFVFETGLSSQFRPHPNPLTLGEGQNKVFWQGQVIAQVPNTRISPVKIFLKSFVMEKNPGFIILFSNFLPDLLLQLLPPAN